MTERFRKAYDALVNAYFSGTLAKGTCIACACGNIIAAAGGVTLTKSNIFNVPSYDSLFDGELDWAKCRYCFLGVYLPRPDFMGKVNIAGYTTEEFAKIETVFESSCRIGFGEYSFKSEQEILEDQYNGLCAVVDVLLELDADKSPGEVYKAKFRQHPKLQVC